MKPNLKIADAGNVAVPAYLALLKKGYVVRCDRGVGDPGETWIAESDTTELLAGDTLALLGLAALAESRGPDWKASDEQIQDFLKTFGYEDVI